ncbi:uncharacterized protein L3040_003457 [Drepanopeziza brunnea f. sp. 'multigermtubi']|uniref:uncharacterized protein n=1 Tax=Drepanopeziza brunnea f. sp. 'multigermtubi' TaxID=698441 RepID=UPI002384ABB2|nr:hypothetical protein L3040_003457 [Drepanopeziza brunnea f. sp. 'multigermtubi']
MARENENKGSPVFETCIFKIILSKELPRKQALELQNTIKDHAGEVLNFEPDFNVKDVTHIISENCDFPQYTSSRDYMIPTVTPAWVSASLLKNREAPIRPYNPDPNNYFTGVTVSCADLPQGDKDAIIGAVLAMGGQETSSVTKLTTHVCALSVDHPKCQTVRDKNLKCKIVLPHWFDDCLKLGKAIDDKPYLLPDPPILNGDLSGDVQMVSSEDVRGATSPRPTTLPMPTDSPTRPLTVFKGKKVMISDDLELGNRPRGVIENLITGGGGSITQSVHNADIYVCHWREGRDYVFASRYKIDVGNLSWLYHLIANNRWTSPLRRLMHYPLPKGGIAGFHGLKITLSNYGGEARTYLENLVVACGAEFTKSMKQENTHLITARNGSEKCDAAREWNIEMINHLWIEESYAKCEIQKMTKPSYTHFPPMTNLGEIIGQTQFDAALLEQKYFPKDPTPSPGDPRPLKRPAMKEKDRNLSRSRSSDVDVTIGGQDEEDDSTSIKPIKKMAAPRKPRISGGAQPMTPAARKRTSTGKGNDTPISTGSRSAKAQAISRLHVIAPDIALYEKEKRRKGTVWGGERAANDYEKQKTAERSSSPAGKNVEEEYSAEEDDAESETRNPKRQRTSLPAVKIRLLITGYKGWLANPSKEDSDKRKLRELGILVVEDPLKCSHLAAPNMVRTQKFLCALATGPTIVTSNFIEASVGSRNGKIPAVEDFLLKDVASEKKFGLKLKDVIVRAKANNRNLLRRVPIYCTNAIPNGSATYKSIVEANGGTFALYSGRPTIKKTNPEDDVGPAEPVYLLTGQSPAERALWPKFERMAKEGNMIPRIVDSEWLLDVAMSQQYKWNEDYLITKR